MMKRIYSFLMICMLFAGNVFASDNLYDKYYGRPSFFPQYTASTSYANNMNYIVKAVASDGLSLENYEIAVYDQDNELRAIGRSQVNSNDICMLTICGTEGDTFRFEVLYGDIVRPTAMKIKETCKFKTNAIVGLETPFTLTADESGKAANVCYTLSNVSKGDFRTVCLPYEVDCSNGYAYEITSYLTGEGLNLTSVETLEAGKPYFVRSSSTGDVDFIYHNIVAGATTKVSAPVSNNGLIGTFEDNGNVPDGMYILSSNQLYKVDRALAFKANRAYVDLNQIVNSTNPAKGIFIGFVEGGGTRISEISDTESASSVYSMNGIKKQSLKPGINIVRMSDGSVRKLFIK